MDNFSFNKINSTMRHRLIKHLKFLHKYLSKPVDNSLTSRNSSSFTSFPQNENVNKCGFTRSDMKSRLKCKNQLSLPPNLLFHCTFDSGRSSRITPHKFFFLKQLLNWIPFYPFQLFNKKTIKLPKVKVKAVNNDLKMESMSGSRKDDREVTEAGILLELAKEVHDRKDLQVLLEKIMKHMATIIGGDKSSLFLVRDESCRSGRELVCTLFDVDQESQLYMSREGVEKNCTCEDLSIPWGVGVVGYVAEFGESVNIVNCYEDSRFFRSIDESTGYRTKNMLCSPILDGYNKIVGVAQVINKRNGDKFTKSDAIIFKRYLQFCGICLRNAQLYQNLRKENQYNQSLISLTHMIFEEQSNIDQMMNRYMTHLLPLMECQSCQLLLTKDAGFSQDQLYFRHSNFQLPGIIDGVPDLSSNVNSNEKYDIFSRVYHLEAKKSVACRIQDVDFSHFPLDTRILSYVLNTGKALIISPQEKSECSIKSDSLSCPSSLLCTPIHDAAGQIIGLIQLTKKHDKQPFNDNDVKLLEDLLVYCGLGIQVTNMHKHFLKITALQQVTFDVLSYHATSPFDEAMKLNIEDDSDSSKPNLFDLKFDDFSLDDVEMLKSCRTLFIELGLVERFHINESVLGNWIISVYRNYRKMTYHPSIGGKVLKFAPVCYHNWRHAFNVAQLMFAILVRKSIRTQLRDTEVLALMIACFCHDLDHRGTNNSFQIKSASPLVELYSKSIMEHHHFNHCMMILRSQGNQILSNLSQSDYLEVIELIKEAILATDLCDHLKKRAEFLSLIEGNKFDWNHNINYRNLLKSILMTACDVGAISKPWHIQKRVAELIMSEFYNQGDIEKQELNLEPEDFMNRDKSNELPKIQVNFIDSICEPIYSALTKVFPNELDTLLEGCISNRAKWKEMDQMMNQMNV